MIASRLGLLSVVVFFAAGASLLAAPLPAQEFRTWADSSGRFKIEAKFVSESGGKVTLENAAGKRFEIPLDKLSPADQKVVASLNTTTESPFQAVEQNPFEAQTPASLPATEKLIWANVMEVNPAPASAEWKPNLGGNANGDAATPNEPVRYRPIPTPEKAGFFEKYKGMAVSTASGRVLIGYSLEDRKEKTLRQRYLLADLKQGKLAPFEVNDLTESMAPLALSDDGTTALMRRNDWGFGKSDRLELWKFTASGIQRTLSWEPYGDAQGGNRDISWGEYLSGDRAVTISGGGKLVVWDTTTTQPVYQFAIKGGCVPGLSRDRKYLAYVRDEDLGILDLAKGEVVVARAIGNTAWPHLQISPEGTKVACVDHSRLRVLDGNTGELILDTPKRDFPSGTFFFVDEEHLLIGNRILFNIPNQLKVWTYEGLGASAPLGKQVCLFTGGGPGLLMVESLPQAEVPAAMAAALKQPDFWALQPGTTVRIKTDEIADAAQRESIQKVLSEKLTAAGFQVGEAGTIDLIASVAESDKPREVKYGRGFSPFGPGTEYKVREFKSGLRFEIGGEVAWEQGATNIPGMLHLKDGQGVKEALKEHEKPNYTWFEKVEFPQVLPKPSAKNTLGTTKVTSAGLR